MSSSSIRDLIMEEDPLAAAILLDDVQWLEELLLSSSSDNDNPNNNSTSSSRNVNYTVPYTSNTPLLLAITSCNDPSICLQMVQLLIEKGGADIECGNTFHGVTPLMAACTSTSTSTSGCQQEEEQNLELTKYLLSQGANVHVRTTNGRTPLINCCKNGNLPLVKLLVEDYQADVLLYDEQAKNALMHACTENHLEVVKYLLDYCNNNNNIPNNLVNDFKVDTAMWYACAAGNAEIVQLLIDRGGHIEYRQDGTIYSTTPLMEACEWGHLHVVETLLFNGANATSRTGQKALKLAKSAGHHSLVQLMTLWQQRINGLELFLKSSDCYCNDRPNLVPPSLLPLVLSKTGRRLDLVNRIVYQRWDVIVNKGGCPSSSSS